MATSLTDNINLFQPTGFKLIIDRKNYGNLEFFAQSVTHPGVTLQAVETPYSRIAGVPFAGDVVQVGELNVNVLMDEDFNAYTEIYNWMERLVQNKQTSTRTAIDTGGLSSETDITIIALTSHNNSNKTIVYRSALPTAIGDVTFEANNQGEFFTFPVSFRFTYFELR